MSFDTLLTCQNFADDRCSSSSPLLRARIEPAPDGRARALWFEKIADDPRGGYWSSLIICTDRDAALAWIRSQAAGREFAWDSEP